ncbi:unnamed protein product [Alopecurus aequalis]
MTIPRDSSRRTCSSMPSYLFLCFFHLLVAPSSAAPILQTFNCSTSDNYTTTDAYAVNVNQLLAALPESVISKNGGFFNGTVGLGPGTVYGLAMCPADYSRSDCGDCLTAAASDADGLRSICPGSRTVLAMFDRCLVRYSDVNFFGTPEIGAVYTTGGESVSASWKAYSDELGRSLSEATSRAEISPQRWASSVGRPYVLVQCTWDLPVDKCKQCLDVLSGNVTDIWVLRREGQQRSYSCSVRYSNTTFMIVPLVAPSPPGQNSVDQPATSSAPPPSSSSGARAVIVVGPVVAVVVVASLIASLLYMRKRKRQRKQNTHDITPTGVRVHDGRFTYKQLERATSNFKEGARLGQGAFGAVYKGTLQVEGQEREVAIKKILDTTSEQSKKDFANECTLMRGVNHNNVVKILGFCDDIDGLCLVYELMENGNLDDKLYHMENSVDFYRDKGTDPADIPLWLEWNKRHNIIVGIASGLTYLHNECKERLLHGDIKPSNVMLDRCFNAKLCDFGLVKQSSHNETSQSTVNIRGTKIYADPAYIATGNACVQNDVYSFGLVILEIVCCERPTMNTAGNRNNLVKKVLDCHYQKNAILEAADKRLKGASSDKQLERMLMIGLLCVQTDHRLRPSMKSVLNFLENEKTPLPHLPAANHTLPTVNEGGSAPTTSYDQYNTSLTVQPAHSQAEEDAGTAAFLTSKS